uniref:Uncharacterized protein n=1 Tax=Takifugu rubripes TaxID=31033 RepID=A0A3B5KMD0_TAKRU
MNSQDLPTKDGPLTVNEQVIVMSGQETIRVLEVEVDAPPSQRDKATTLHRETETMDRPLPPSEDPQVEPPWRTVILADRQWNGWKEVDAPVPSSAPDGKSEATSSFHTAAAGSHATGDLSAITGDRFPGHRRSGGCGPADHRRHFCFSAQHFCGGPPDGGTLHQSCHCEMPSVCPAGLLM